MGRLAWAVYLWPGLPHLWKRGAWSGLVAAVGFGLLLNLALVSSFVWKELELLPAQNRMCLWVAVAVVWVASAGFSAGWNRRYDHRADRSARDGSFGEALDQYLQQNWYEAERTLAGLLRRNPRDLEARLMLAGVLRRTERLDEAVGQLDRLSRMEGSQKWEREIDQQRERLAEPASPSVAETCGPTGSSEEEKIAA
jgi:hypothetical protein